MVKTVGVALQHGALGTCVFAADCQNPEKSARHFKTVKERIEGAEYRRPQVVAQQCSATHYLAKQRPSNTQ